MCHDYISQVSVLPEAVGHIELDSGAEIAELKEALAKESYRVESLEKDMKQIRRVVEDTYSEQLEMGLQVAASNKEEFLPGAMASGNVEAKVRVLQNHSNRYITVMHRSSGWYWAGSALSGL